MGRGTITFSDNDDGTVSVSIAFDPPLDARQDEATPAQWMLLEKWQQLNELDEEDHDF